MSAHRMPFGAELTDSGAVRFRLWAPAARRVELVLPDASHAIAMSAQPDGWFELLTQSAHAGSRYRFRIDGAREVPDPASRYNPQDVHGASEVIDPNAYPWSDAGWRAPPWHEAVLYELHVGTFTQSGSYSGIAEHLPHLAGVGINAIELMPLAEFPGRRGWGYDGVLPYAPESSYGTPAELKALIDAAHGHGIAVILDVVYNHFGPEGNYLGVYAPQFFTDRHQTPWGAAINFDGPHNRTVRDFYSHNALYWLAEYHIDGLRFDAVHAIRDDSKPHILTEIARVVRAGPGRSRRIYLIVENVDNEARFLGPQGGAESCDAQWNDDVHHCSHVILTGESDGYYEDYAADPHALLCRALSTGFAYQGERSKYLGRERGEPSGHLPPTAFINFMQNHDQIGNRARGERLTALVGAPEPLRAFRAMLLLAPQPPLLFMGEEWGALEPFPYFCDFEPELGAAVRAGRLRDFARFAEFRDPALHERLPDPTAAATFRSACLDWSALQAERHAGILEDYRRLLALRRREIAPRIPDIRASRCAAGRPPGLIAVDWSLADGATLRLLANLSPGPGQLLEPVTGGRVIFATHPDLDPALSRGSLVPWSVIWLLEREFGAS